MKFESLVEQEALEKIKKAKDDNKLKKAKLKEDEVFFI